MTPPLPSRLRSERGVFGSKLIIGVLVLLIVIAAAIDGAAILVTSFGVSDAAQQASFDGAVAYKATRDVRSAERAASASVAGQGGKLVHLIVDKNTGAVTVTVVKEAPTIFLQHLSFLPDWRRVKETDTAEAPP